MHQPPEEKPSKRSKVKQASNLEMMENLAKCIVEVLKADSAKCEDPFEDYAHQLKVRLYKDDKSFCHQFVQGYEVLLANLLK